MRTTLLAAATLLALAPSVEAATVLQGGLAKWSGLGAKECGFKGKRFPALDAVCWYPVDLREKPGVHEVALYDQDGKQHTANLTVEERICLDVPIELEDTTLVDLAPDAAARHEEERAAVLKAIAVDMRDPTFSLPLATPVASLPTPGEDFCEQRIFNEKRKSTHTGRDYAVGVGTEIRSPADGEVVLSADHLMTGNSVYVDHGGGLVTMVFHLSERAVEQGTSVKRGDVLGKVGETGRTTGPHLHFGTRWNGARVDAGLLLAETTSIPDIANPDEVKETAQAEKEAAKEVAKNEQDMIEEKDEATGD